MIVPVLHWVFGESGASALFRAVATEIKSDYESANMQIIIQTDVVKSRQLRHKHVEKTLVQLRLLQLPPQQQPPPQKHFHFSSRAAEVLHLSQARLKSVEMLDGPVSA